MRKPATAPTNKNQPSAATLSTVRNSQTVILIAHFSISPAADNPAVQLPAVCFYTTMDGIDPERLYELYSTEPPPANKNYDDLIADIEAAELHVVAALREHGLKINIPPDTNCTEHVVTLAAEIANAHPEESAAPQSDQLASMQRDAEVLRIVTNFLTPALLEADREQTLEAVRNIIDSTHLTPPDIVVLLRTLVALEPDPTIRLQGIDLTKPSEDP